MSNLLERAIIDAKALKEAALKNAEQLVVEKYQLEVKEAMDKLLEQDELGGDMGDMGGMGDIFDDQPEATEETPDMDQGISDISPEDLEAELPNAFDTDDDQIIQIKLDSLEDDFEDEEGVFGGDDEFEDGEIGIDIETEDELDTTADFDMATPDVDTGADIGVDIDSGLSPAALEEIIADALKDVLSEDEELEEVSADVMAKTPPRDKANRGDFLPKHVQDEINDEAGEDLDEEIDLEALMEKVRVEGIPQKSGWAGTPESIMQEYESMLLAREQDSEVKEENEELRKNVAALQKENKTLSSAALKLQEQNKKFNTTFKTLQEKLETMNVSNAKLLYINQALENASLNERQKRKIVEAISKAETVQEAKIVFETMNDTVATTSDVKKDRTLSEMVSRKSSLLVAARKEQPKQDANPMYNRLQKLAGIKTK